jgi:hypothetical protein
LHSRYQMTRAGISVTLGKPFDKELLYRGMRQICHQTMHVKKEVYTRFGLFNTQYKGGMDYDYLIRMRNEPFLFVNHTLVEFDNTGYTGNNYLKGLKEAQLIYESHFGSSLKLKIWHFRLRLLFKLLNSPIGKFLYAIKRKLLGADW